MTTTIYLYILASAYDLLVLVPLAYRAGEYDISADDSSDIGWVMFSIFAPPVMIPVNISIILTAAIKAKSYGVPWQIYVNMVDKLKDQ